MKSRDKSLQPPIEITPSSLSDEVLTAVMESFILREGTDYGLNEISLEKKIENLKRKLDKKDIVLVFDPNSESVTFLTQNQFMGY